MNVKEGNFMNISVRKFEKRDLKYMTEIWNEVVEDGIAFPQTDTLDVNDGDIFFSSQTYCGVACSDNGEVYGLYILHPNNVGRCGHICNASYAVKSTARNMGIGEKLVKDCMGKSGGKRF